MKAEELDKLFDDDEDMSAHIDMTSIRSPLNLIEIKKQVHFCTCSFTCGGPEGDHGLAAQVLTFRNLEIAQPVS